MESPKCVEDCLDASDPLSRNLIKYLVEYSEEDDRLDYKSDFVADEQHWLELVKDVSAFANTHGGYLLFGVDDPDHKVIGIDRALAKLLKNSNEIQQKVNRNLEPPLSTIRAKEYRFDGKSIVALYVPRSRGLSHLVSKDGEFKYPSGTKKAVLKKGTFYVRRAAGHHLGDSRDLDALIERRIEQFQDALKEKIATVVDAPRNSEVFVVTETDSTNETTRFVFSDSDDAVPVSGMTFTKPPETPEQEIMAWRALSSGKNDIFPSPERVWR